MQAKTDYIEGTRLQLDLWGNQFAALEEKIDRSVSEGRRALKKRLARLQLRKRVLKARLRRLATHRSDEWERERGDLEEAVADFRTSAVEVYDHVRRV